MASPHEKVAHARKACRWWGVGRAASRHPKGTTIGKRYSLRDSRPRGSETMRSYVCGVI